MSFLPICKISNFRDSHKSPKLTRVTCKLLHVCSVSPTRSVSRWQIACLASCCCAIFFRFDTQYPRKWGHKQLLCTLILISNRIWHLFPIGTMQILFHVAIPIPLSVVSIHAKAHLRSVDYFKFETSRNFAQKALIWLRNLIFVDIGKRHRKKCRVFGYPADQPPVASCGPGSDSTQQETRVIGSRLG